MSYSIALTFEKITVRIRNFRLEMGITFSFNTSICFVATREGR